MSISQTLLDDCGCCTEPGTAATPVINPAGLSAIAYRIGTQPQFKARMKTAMGTLPALEALTAREDSDPSTALVDAWATVLDVLTFYQERIANEGFLRTAVETQSVYSLAAEIGYVPNPGVAADVYLAFQLENVQGSLPVVTIPSGTRAQSLPDPKTNARPQTFETLKNFDARIEWNSLKPRMKVPQRLHMDEQSATLAGTATLLKPGDALLFVGRQREKKASSQHWDFRVLETVTVDPAASTTTVTWSKKLGHHNPRLLVHPEHSDLHVYAMRTRAGIFGFNAPDWRLMSKELRLHWGVVDPTNTSDPDPVLQWPHFRIFSPHTTDSIDLDAVYSEAALSAYVVLTLENYAQLFKISEATQAARADFGLSGKTTRITFEEPNSLVNFGRHVRDTVVHLQGQELALADLPLANPVHGRSVVLDRILPSLAAGQTLIVAGRPARALVAGQAHDLPGAAGIPRPETHGLTLVTKVRRRHPIVLRAGESVQMTGDIKITNKVTGVYEWQVRTADGVDGTLIGQSWMLNWVPALDSDEMMSEPVQLIGTTLVEGSNTRLELSAPLAGCYDRSSCSLYANVVHATHGETTQEVLGSGDASQRFQTFALKRSPLTYTSSATPGGGTTTLQITVDGVTWTEVPTLYGRGPHDQVYVVRIAADGGVSVEFGDGVNGARLPTGIENVKAAYRVGTGQPGNVVADRIKLLMTRPLGVLSVDNPVGAGAGQDAESLDSARTNAPQQVVTFSRVVSLTDFEDFARGFAGVAKAQADWLWDGAGRVVYVTVAGTGGAKLDAGGLTLANLVQAIASYGDPHQTFFVEPYESVAFGVSASVFVERDADPATVLQAAAKALTDAFGFDQRSLGEPVFESEVIAVIQSATGVQAVDLTALFITSPLPGTGSGLPINYMRLLRQVAGPVPVALPARRARLEAGKLLPAQLLTLDPDQVELTVAT